MTARKAAAGRSTIYQQADGSWRGEVSFGVDPATGRRLRRKVRGQTQDVVAKKVRGLERERDAGVRRTKTRTVASWLEEWIAGRELAVRPTTVRGYRSDVRHIVRTLGRVRIERAHAGAGRGDVPRLPRFSGLGGDRPSHPADAVGGDDDRR